MDKLLAWANIASLLIMAGGLLAVFLVMTGRMALPVGRERALEEQIKDLKAELEATKRELTSAETTWRRALTASQKRQDTLEQDLASARSESNKLRLQLARLEPGARAEDENQVIEIAIGTDPALKVDLAALRAVRAKTGLGFHRILPVTKAELERILNYWRRHEKPVRYLHIATHAGPNGVQFADGVAEAEWLSAQLKDVWILVLAGCQTNAIADLLELVPTVVATSEDLPHEAAWQLTTIFWESIGQGLSPARAWQRCDELLPADLMEMAVMRSWAK